MDAGRQQAIQRDTLDEAEEESSEAEDHSKRRSWREKR